MKAFYILGMLAIFSPLLLPLWWGIHDSRSNRRIVREWEAGKRRENIRSLEHEQGFHTPVDMTCWECNPKLPMTPMCDLIWK